MMKKLMVGAALSALALSCAQAQSPAFNSTPGQPQAVQQTTSGEKLITTQQSDQYLASKFKGTDVLGSDDNKIGDVSDILFDKSGKIDAYIVSVGGILGMGGKEVALAPSAFNVVRGNGSTSDKLKLSMSQDELKQAQNFEPYRSPAATTGSASPSGMGSGALTGGMRPSPTSPPSTNR